MSQKNNFVEQCLLKNLQSVGVPIEKEPQGLRIGQGTPLLQVQDVEVWQHENSTTWVAHIEVAYALNPERTETFLYDCATGWGNDPENAMSLAAEAICKTSAPPIFSLLNSKAILDAEYFPPDDPFGFPGWEAFSSPYILKGNQVAVEQLITHFQENPLLSHICEVLEDSFDKPMLNTIRLYVGFDGGKYHVECRVNNELHEQGKQALLQSNLPKLEDFASISQFLLLLQKTSS